MLEAKPAKMELATVWKMWLSSILSLSKKMWTMTGQRSSSERGSSTVACLSYRCWRMRKPRCIRHMPFDKCKVRSNLHLSANADFLICTAHLSMIHKRKISNNSCQIDFLYTFVHHSQLRIGCLATPVGTNTRQTSIDIPLLTSSGQ